MKKFFFITPYSSDPDFEKKKEIVKTLARQFRLTLFIPDLSHEPKPDIQITLDIMNEVDFAIADLSYERPSCYYEIGYLQGLFKPVYLIAKESSTIHLVKDHSLIQYYKSLDDYQELINNIMEIN